MFKGSANMGPPSVRSLFFRSKESKKKDDIRVTDDDILAVIDEIYLQAKDLLLKGNFEYVLETFLFLTEYDIIFKKIITSQLTNVKGSFQAVLSEDILSFLIMIQSYFNSFRINLLSDVVEFLYAEYSKTMNLMKLNFSESLLRFNKTNSTMMFIINKLKIWYKPHNGDYFFDILYEESKESFLELKLHTAKQLQKLISAQLHLL